jgi:hypothetical protein
MIVKEAKKINLPIIGIVNSHCSLAIDYPIFAQDQSIQSIHFFCYFLATLIVKENLYLQHKRYTLQKTLTKLPSIITNSVSKEENYFFLKRRIKFYDIVSKVTKIGFNKKSLFFYGIKPISKKQLLRQNLSTKPYFFPTTTKKKLSHFQRYMVKHIPPRKLLFKLLHLYLKTLIKSSDTNKISVTFLKDIINFYVFKWDKLKTNSLIDIEKRNKYFKTRITYF